MADFRRYDHLERTGHPEVRGLLDSLAVFIYAKIDGTNASVWYDEDAQEVCCGSRNRKLSLDSDNQGFMAYVMSDDPRMAALRKFVEENPNLVVYGEWLKPHSLKTYRDDAWNRFYVFDVWKRPAERYLSWPEYSEMLPEEVDRIEPMAIIDNPSEEQIVSLLQKNTYLLKDGEGVGEGVVAKSYFWKNDRGRQPWMKLVSTEFREKNAREFGVPRIKGSSQVENEVIRELATSAFIAKEWNKVVAATAEDMGVDMWSMDNYANIEEEFVQANRAKLIPRFLGTVFHVFIEEEMWGILKKWKNPTIDFKRLQSLLTMQCKQVLKEVF